MSLLSRSAFVLILSGASIGAVACNGSASSSSSSSGAGTATQAQQSLCQSSCETVVACVDPSCVIADETATKAACATVCEAGFAGLSSAESATVSSCISCLAKIGCDPSSASSCESVCSSDVIQTYAEASDAAISSAGPAIYCENGSYVVGPSSCSGTGTAGSCTASCCNGMSCTTPDVELSCTGATCTCTAGKNKGKQVQTSSDCSGDVWTLCNG